MEAKLLSEPSETLPSPTAPDASMGNTAAMKSLVWEGVETSVIDATVLLLEVEEPFEERMALAQ